MDKGTAGRLLVVDDDREFLTPFCEILSELGYEATAFASAAEALSSLSEKEFDLLLSDLVMPRMDGIVLLQAAMEIDPYLVCVIVTGQGTVHSAVEAMKAGAFDYLLKPVEIKTLVPILSRAMAVRRLKRSEEKYRTIVEDQTELVNRFLPDGTLTFVNEAACRYFMKAPDELIGRNFMSFIPDEDREMIRRHLTSINPENPVVTIEHRLITVDGGIGWIQWTNRAIFDQKKEAIEFQAVGRDITERKKTEDELRDAKKRLQSISKSLLERIEKERRFIARELHDEIGQSLTALRINLQKMQKSPNSFCCTDSIKQNMEIVEHLLGQVRKLSLDLRPSLLDDLGLVPALRWYVNRVQQSGLPVSFITDSMESRLPLEIETACFRVIQEALTNALRHSKARRVTVELRLGESVLHVCVRDDGSGFDVRSTQRRAVKGESFGLLSMQERAVLVGGAVEIESSPGKGTSIRARFPLRERT